MKTNAIVRIVLFGLAILVLLGILLAGLGVGLYTFNGQPYISNTENNQIVSEGNGTQVTVNASEIRKLEIDWTAGNITISPAGGTDQIVITESEVTNAKYQMICRQSGDKLTIEFCEENIVSGFGINFNSTLKKDLEILVPTDWVCEELEIDAAAASVEVSNMMINNMNFDGASGICNFVDCALGKMELETASGDVRFSGTLDTLSCESMSAKCNLVLKNVPARLDLSTMSGDLDITLPDYCGFTVSLDAMSSDFTSDFPTTNTNGNHVYGDGSCRINVDAMSGDVTIRKGTEGSYTDENHF